MVANPTPVARFVRLASDSARVVANKVLEADFAQTVMVLVTVAAGVTYGWIELLSVLKGT